MKNLGTYLKDHHAGSVAALELIDHLLGGSPAPDFAVFLQQLRADIAADQAVLRNVLETLGDEESAWRNAAAWVAEKLGRPKLSPTADDDGLGVFQALETLQLGIAGKRSLWRTLTTLGDAVPAVAALDLATLESRAVAQLASVESMSLRLAPSVFAPK